MYRVIRHAVCALLSCVALSMALETEGMVLLRAVEDNASKLIVKYLSTGSEVIIQDGRVSTACFSPDGRKVVYHHVTDPNQFDQRRKDMYTMNTDGSDRIKVMTSQGYTATGIPNWCTNGYIYFGHGTPFIRRVPENGGPAELVYTATEGTSTPTGGYVSPAVGQDFQVSLDGTRGVGTVQNWTADSTKAGWAQLLIRLDLQEQYCIARPCQSGMAPSGDRMSVSQQAHRIYRIYSWDMPFVDYGEDGNTFEGCIHGQFSETKKCPEELDVILAAYDIADMEGLGSAWADLPEFGSPKWSNSDDDIFVLTDTRQSTGAWIYRISTREYTNVAPDGYKVLDFFATEIYPMTAFSMAPQAITIDYDPGDPAPVPRIVTLVSASAMSEPTITGGPSWLQVTPNLVDPDTCKVSVALNLPRLPSEGSYTGTFTVVPGGSADTLTCAVSLRVGPPPPEPIVVLQPTGGATFAVGDTLHIVYDADSLQAAGTVVSLSLNEGEDWFVLHTGESWGTGTGVVLDYVIPDTVLVGASMTSTVSNGCMVRVNRYPDGLDAFSAVFQIVENNSVALTRRHNRSVGLGAAVECVRHTTTLAVDAPAHGAARLVDMQGRTVRAFAVRAGRQRILLAGLEAGRYLLDLRSESGDNAYRLVEAVQLGL